ncbi:hypothetical protein PYW08_003591 [Mythimna loreyi]|uniref:Uncharacterized protein n=1 Tax=Mythimna loreyi TaxID=667449 RepID=A0ACC2QU33_9NEOP|nr:hypothetical protein PYW08_003591 [Mythimna loreyi]
MLMSLMEGDTITTNTLISSIKKFNNDGKQHGTIKALLKNFILPETEMAIKENQNNGNKYIYTVPVKPPIPTLTDRMKSINDAKQAFLNSTVSSTVAPTSLDTKKETHTVHYAQIAITTDSEDTRSTGGGRDGKHSCAINNKEYSIPVNVSPSIKKTIEQHQRKVSFKIKTAASSYKRPPLAKTMTITSSNVAELTKKFNNLQTEPHVGTPKQSKLSKTLEELQSASRCSASNSSTPSSTLSSSPNIKIVLRQRRGSKKRSNRKRCSSMDSMDDLLITENSNKIRVIRSKSDGTKMPKTSKKRLKYQDSSEQQSGSDSVDGSPVKAKEEETKKVIKPIESTVVKNVIKKFEYEITAQTNSNNTLKRQPDKTKSTIPVKEKPKVPEKKSSLVLTKNLVVKDGIPKIKTIKPVTREIVKLDKTTNQSPEIIKRKEPLYDRKRYKTNYIHSEKLPLKVVEIIPEDIHESNTVTVTINNEQKEEVPVVSVVTPNEGDKIYQEINSPITPNESFLWRRKSSTQIYSDSEKSDNSYSFVSVTTNATTISCSDEPQKIAQEESQVETNESQVNISTTEQQSDANSDFESALVEACNKEIIVGFTSKPKQEEVEDYYEPLEPRDDENIVIIPIKSVDRSSKINCPLPEIPKVKNDKNDDECTDKDNIYQCLLEMRSHPEGDESSLHNYELCDNDLEERTRGDGDSDDGYEYCKSPPIKPYCLTSSSGIQIAEDYQPFAKNNSKNYAISKSVSGASTVSYEKIGPVSERIYEKIPARPPKSKDSSPTYSSRHSFISDYTVYNENENIYDTIKHGDATSLSHCYESIPNSPSMVKLRNDMRKQAASNVQKRLSFDTVSNISQSTMSSEQKTNSLYGQRSVISYNGQEIAFQVPSSETSVSDRSDRSDDWVDVSDEEKNEQKIIIVRERSRGRKSPISWSQKVRHQWQKSPKPNGNDKGVLLKWRFWYTYTFATVATKGSRVGEGRRLVGARESALRPRCRADVLPPAAPPRDSESASFVFTDC